MDASRGHSGFGTPLAKAEYGFGVNVTEFVDELLHVKDQPRSELGGETLDRVSRNSHQDSSQKRTRC